jgi:hypothetical protein
MELDEEVLYMELDEEVLGMELDEEVLGMELDEEVLGMELDEEVLDRTFRTDVHSFHMDQEVGGGVCLNYYKLLGRCFHLANNFLWEQGFHICDNSLYSVRQRVSTDFHNLVFVCNNWEAGGGACD